MIVGAWFLLMFAVILFGFVFVIGVGWLYFKRYWTARKLAKSNQKLADSAS